MGGTFWEFKDKRLIEFNPFLNLPRSDTCEGDISACPGADAAATTTSPKPASGPNSVNKTGDAAAASVLGFLKRMIYW